MSILSLWFPKKGLILTLIISNIITVKAAFDCSIATTSTHCSQLSGCNWNTNSCTGIYTPSCPSSTCYFIQASNSAQQSPSGTKSQPFRDLDQALASIGTGNAEIFIVKGQNQQSQQVSLQQITVAITISSNITIKPLFSDQKYELDLTLNQNQQCIFSLTGSYNSFTIIGAQLKLSTINSIANGTAIFCNINQQSTIGNKLILQKSSFKDLNSLNTLFLAKVNKGGFTFESNTFDNSNLLIDIQSPQSFTMNQNSFINLVYANDFIKLYEGESNTNAFTFNSNIIKNISSTISYFIFAESKQGLKTTFSSQQTRYEDIKGLLLKIYGFKLIQFTQVHFFKVNFTEESQFPLMYMRGQGYGYTEHKFDFCTFKNIKVRHTILHTMKGTTQMFGVLYQNIFRKRLGILAHGVSGFDTQYLDRLQGVCLVTTIFSEIKITSSIFTSIDANCIAVEGVNVQIYKTVFSNRDFVTKNPKYWDQFKNLEQDPGMRWLSISGYRIATKNSIIPQGIFDSILEYNGGNPKYGGGVKVYSERYTGYDFKQSIAIRLNAKYGGFVFAQTITSNVVIWGFLSAFNSATFDGGFMHFLDLMPRMKKNYNFKFVSSGVFYENSAGRNGGSFLVDRMNFQYRDSLIIRNKARNGAGLYLIDLVRVPEMQPGGPWEFWFIGADNLVFQDNYASETGPAIKFQQNVSLLINPLNITLIRNTLPPTRKDWGLELIQYGAPTYYELTFYKIDPSVTILEVDDLEKVVSNTSISTLKHKFFHNNISQNFILEVQGGKNFPYILQIDILDQLQQRMLGFSGEEIYFTLVPDNSSDTFNQRFKSQRATFTNGRAFVYKNVEFHGMMNSNAIFKIKTYMETSSQIKDSLNLIDISLKTFFKNCDLGEEFDRTQQVCKACTKGLYNLNDPMEKYSLCKKCPSKGICLGGTEIGPKPGYYRTSEQSIDFTECEEAEDCLGTVKDNVYSALGHCKSPAEGFLCHQCIAKYARFGNLGQCVDCKSDALYYVKFVALILIQSTFLFIITKLSIVKGQNVLKQAQSRDRNTLGDSFQPEKSEIILGFIKIIINFHLFKGIIHIYTIKQPNWISSIFNAIFNILPSNEKALAIDCLIALASKEQDNIFYVRLIVLLFKPILLLMIYYIVEFIYNKCRKSLHKPNSSEKLSNSTKRSILSSSLFYMVYTELITNALGLLNCQKFDTGNSSKYVLQYNPNIECYKNEYFIWVFLYTLPIAIIGIFLLPIKLYKRVKVVNNNFTLKTRFSLFLCGFKQKYQYWEFVILFRKIIAIMILQLLPFLQKGGQFLMTYLFILSMFLLQNKIKPFVTLKLNRLECLSLLASFMVLMEGTYSLFKDIDLGNNVSLFLSILSISTTILFYAFAFINIYYVIKGKSNLEISSQGTNKEQGQEIEINPSAIRDRIEEETNNTEANLNQWAKRSHDLHQRNYSHFTQSSFRSDLVLNEQSQISIAQQNAEN